MNVGALGSDDTIDAFSVSLVSLVVAAAPEPKSKLVD